ncbi:hypothetical protein F5051DRAFT_428181 [Lentinula edodes]|nr:hypothetical protein F5051DRAFT_428181 [Lentinula edodes]
MARTCVLLALLFTSTLPRYIPRFDDSESTEAIVASLSAPNFTTGRLFRLDPLAQVLGGIMDLCAVLKQSPDAIQCPIVKAKPTKTYGRRSADTTDSTATATATATPTPSYTAVFTDLDASIEGSGYITYGLVDTNADCETFCNTVSNCIFLNSYYDVNGKDESPKLTCSLYSVVHTAAEATNKGGQTEPDGFMDYIANSSGYALITS